MLIELPGDDKGLGGQSLEQVFNARPEKTEPDPTTRATIEITASDPGTMLNFKDFVSALPPEAFDPPALDPAKRTRVSDLKRGIR